MSTTQHTYVPAVTSASFYDKPYAGTATRAPSIAATVWITLLFGLFGLIPATMHSSRAAALGQPTGKYWAAFIGILLLWVFLIAAL